MLVLRKAIGRQPVDLNQMNQLAMLTKAAEVQARVREQMQAKALIPAPAGGAMNFGFAEGETLRFG